MRQGNKEARKQGEKQRINAEARSPEVSGAEKDAEKKDEENLRQLAVVSLAFGGSAG
jgi:hypothetical protein